MDPDIRAYERRHLDPILELCEEADAFAGFASDRDRAAIALEAPGAVALVAARDEGVIGFSHALTDGAFQAFLSLLLVAPAERRKGVGRRLLAETIARCGAERLDLLSYEDAAPLYASFPHERFVGVAGFRLRGPGSTTKAIE